MGRKGSGVEVREKSIRLSFTVAGTQHRYTLKINGAPAAPTPANVKYAHRVATDIRRDIERGTFDLARYFPEAVPPTGDGVTLETYLPTWLTSLRVEPTTRRSYSSTVRFWIAAECDSKGAKLGKRLLSQVTASDINTALALRPDLNPATINNYRIRLHAALRAAVEDKLIPENPVSRVKTAKQQQRPPDPFSRDEIEKILADLRDRAPEPVWNLAEWWAFSGPRTGEALGLRWPQVDLAASYYEVSETRVRSAHKERTKTGETRHVIMNSRALAAIQRQRKHSQAAGSFVWTQPDGTPWPGEYAFQRVWWAPCLRRLGIRYRRPYNMRHTHATLMLMAGVNPAFAAKQLGHSVELFLGTYSRWIDGDANAREMALIEAALGGNATRKVG